jgi:hypothetical protein
MNAATIRAVIAEPAENVTHEMEQAALAAVDSLVEVAAKGCEFGCGPTGEEYVEPGVGLVPACPVHGWMCVLLETRDQLLTRYRTALQQIVKHSLLNVRRAAFGPEIGTKMTEAYRADIADECRRLEEIARAALDTPPAK